MSASAAVTHLGKPGSTAISALVAFAACVGCAPLWAGSAKVAESYPTKPVRVVTAATSGSKDFVARLSSSIIGMVVPAKTNGRSVERLNREVVRALQEPGIRERLFRVGMEAVATRADELAATVQSEIVKYGNLIRMAGIRAD